MCGRYSLYSDVDELNSIYDTASDLALKPRFNIAPESECPIVRLNDGKREIIICHWGLIPHWAKDDKIKPINAKAETVKKKPFFRNAFRHQRCLVPANGYYEWQATNGRKKPWYIYPADEPLISFAGLWETWEGGDEPRDTFTIITTAANEKTAAIHDRMPVIISPEYHDDWLQEGKETLLRPYPDDALATHSVSTVVNNPKNEGKDLIQPI